MSGDFVNEGESVSDIVSWISAGQTRILGVHGPAGVGKSRVVIVALDTQSEYRTVAVRCDALTDEAMLTAALALAFDTPLAGTLAGLTLGNIARISGNKPILVFMDNADSIIAPARSFAQRLTDSLPSAKVIITSREAITGNSITNTRIYPLRVK